MSKGYDRACSTRERGALTEIQGSTLIVHMFFLKALFPIRGYTDAHETGFGDTDTAVFYICYFSEK